MKTNQQSSPLPWILLLLAVAFVDWIVVQWTVQRVGPQAIPIFLISFLFLYIITFTRNTNKKKAVSQTEIVEIEQPHGSHKRYA